MYDNILLPVDLNEESSWKKALPTATGLCRAFGAKLHIMTVVPDFGMVMVGSFFPGDYGDKAQEAAKTALDEFIAANVGDGIEATPHVGYGNIYEEILKASVDVAAELVVIAAARPDLKDFLLGPNAARVVRHAECSVMVVRE